MAAASGQPQDSPTKKEITPEQKKTYAALGVLGLLALIAGGMYIPGMLRGSSTSDATVVSTTPNTLTSSTASSNAASSGATGSLDPFAADGAAGGAAAGGAVKKASAGPLAPSRPDPFQEAYLIPTPLPPVPPPVGVPLPGDVMPVNLPSGNFRESELSRPLVLPPVAINRLDEAARRPVDAFPPRRSTEGAGSAAPSFDKRLSGVVIGDGVRALLEIQGPNGVVTRNVQPGDEVDGITVLNIQRTLEGGRTVTRMLIRENGEEKSVELKASPQPLGDPTGGLGVPGASGMPGPPGMPGMPR